MNRKDWILKCNYWKNKWPVYLPEYANDKDGLDIYQVIECINSILTDRFIVMVDAGSPSYAGPTNFKAKAPGQFIFNPSQADMGWAIPASIGVGLNADNKTTLVMVGDGSFYSNMQELAVIRHHMLNVKILVLNNNGYLSIKNTQTKYFEGRVSGVDEKTGLYFPDLKKVSESFDIKYRLALTTESLLGYLNDCQCYSSYGPEIIEVICKKEQEILPAQSFKILEDGTKVQAPLHDMAPFLSKEELEQEWDKK